MFAQFVLFLFVLAVERLAHPEHFVFGFEFCLFFELLALGLGLEFCLIELFFQLFAQRFGRREAALGLRLGEKVTDGETDGNAHKRQSHVCYVLHRSHSFHPLRRRRCEDRRVADRIGTWTVANNGGPISGFNERRSPQRCRSTTQRSEVDNRNWRTNRIVAAMRRMAKLSPAAIPTMAIRIITNTKPLGMEYSARIGPGMKPAVIVSVVQWHFDPPTRIRQTGGG